MKETVKKNPVRLINRLGQVVWTFKSINDAAKYYNWLYNNNNVNDTFDKVQYGVYHHGERFQYTPTVHHILRDDDDNIVSMWDLWEIIKPKRKRSRYNWNSWAKRKSGKCYRHPKTTQERRMAYAIDEEYPIKVRSKRNATNLTDYYDDVYFSYWKNKNWKKYRKHQWKD